MLVAPALAVLVVLAAAAVASVLAVLLTLFSELVVPDRGKLLGIMEIRARIRERENKSFRTENPKGGRSTEGTRKMVLAKAAS